MITFKFQYYIAQTAYQQRLLAKPIGYLLLDGINSLIFQFIHTPVALEIRMRIKPHTPDPSPACVRTLRDLRFTYFLFLRCEIVHGS